MSFVRHGLAGSLSIGMAYLFWLTRPEWTGDMRFWKAIGDASLILLFVTMSLGPIARVAPAWGRLVLLRREMGVWFGLLALLHTYLILDGWVRWDVMRFFGYEFIPQAGRQIRMESGFGMANLLGLLAVIITIPLIATSTDWAVKKLGGSTWKFLHFGTYIIFWLVVLHVLYFLFIHFTLSFHRAPPPADWFRYPFVALTFGVLALQAAGFAKTLQRRGTSPQT